jgi:hypothetical protein
MEENFILYKSVVYRRTRDPLLCLQRKTSIKELESGRRDKPPVCVEYVNGNGRRQDRAVG